MAKCYETRQQYVPGEGLVSYRVEVPCPPPKKTTGGGGGTNKYGGPKGTKKDAAGRNLSDPRHTANRGGGGSSGSTGGTGASTGKQGSSGETAAQAAKRQAAAEAAAAKAAAEAARKAAEAAIRKQVRAKAEKRGKKLANQLKARKDAIAQAQQANNQNISRLNKQISEAAKSGNTDAARALAQQREGLIRQNNYLNKKGIEAKSGYNRIGAGQKFRERLDDIRANDALDDVQKRRRLRNLKSEREAEKRAAIRGSSVPSVAKIYYGNKKPGDHGYGKRLKSAITDLSALQIADPDNFDPEALDSLGRQLVKHEKAVSSRYDRFVKGYEKDVAVLDPGAIADIKKGKNKSVKDITARIRALIATGDPDDRAKANELREQRRTVVAQNKKLKDTEAAPVGSRKWIRARNRMLRRFDEYDMEGDRREFRLLYGPPPKTNIKGTKVPKPGQQGLFNLFAVSAEEAYASAENRQRELLYGTGITGFTTELNTNIKVALISGQAEASRRQIEDPPGSGKFRKQTHQERLNEMFQQGAMSQDEATELGQQQFRDFENEALEVQDSPALKALYDLFEAEGIKTNEDLSGPFAVEKFESHQIPKAIDNFWEDWKNSDNYAVPGESEGIFDKNRYGRDDDGEFFQLADGTVVRVGDPLPEGHPSPLWGHTEDVGLTTQLARGASFLFPPLGIGLAVTGNEINITDTFDRAMDHARASYEERTRQRAEDDMRAALRIEDPGFLGDLFRHNAAGEILSTFDAVPGALALAWQNYNQSKTGINRPKGQSHIIQDSKEFKTFVEENAALYANDEYYFEVHTSDQEDPVGTLFSALGFSASKYMSIDEGEEEGDDPTVTAGVMVSLPVVGPMEFIWEFGPEADRERAEANESAQQSFEAMLNGDFGVAARTLGTNEVYQFGNMAGVANFAWYLLMDPSNFIPGITLGKKGLSGVRAAIGAGKAVPPGTGKLATLVEGFRGFGKGLRTDIKAAEIITRTTKNFEALVPGATRADILTGLARARAGIDDGAKGDELIKQIGRELNKQFGLDRLGLDNAQIRQIAEESANAIMTRMGWLIHTQADEAAEHINKMEEVVRLVNAEARAIDDAVQARNARVIEVLAQEGQQARRDASRVRKGTEDFETTALDLANKHSKSSLERLAKNARTAPARRLYGRALELKTGRGEPSSLIDELGPLDKTAADAVADSKANDALWARREAARKRGRTPRKQAASPAERKKLRDIELRERDQLLRAERRARIKTQRIEREIAAEGEKVERLVEQQRAFTTRTLVDRVQRVIGVNADLRHTSVPASWAKADGPQFWNGLTGRLRTAKRPQEAIQDATRYAAGIMARYGRFHMNDAGSFRFMNKVLADVKVDPKFNREFFKEFLRSQGALIVGDTLDPAGAQIITGNGQPVGATFRRTDGSLGHGLAEFQQYIDEGGLFDLIETPQGVEFVTRVMMKNAGDLLDNRDMLTLFMVRQQFFGATSDEAIDLLKAVGNDGHYDLFIRDMFDAEFNEFRQFAGDWSLQIRDEVFQQLSEMPIARLNTYMNPPLKRNEALFATGAFAMRPGAPVVGFEGLSLDDAFRALDETLRTGADLGPHTARQLDTLVRAALYQSITAKDWELARTLSKTLAQSGNKTKAGRLARAMRQRMFRELEILGIEPEGILYRVTQADLEDIPDGATRVFRGYDSRAGKGPLTALSAGGGGGRVFGPGFYVTPDYQYAAGYAGFYAAQRGGHAQVSSFIATDDVLMDLRPFTGDVLNEAEDILRRASGQGSNAAQVPTEGEVRAAETMQLFLRELREEFIQAGESAADAGNSVRSLQINDLFGAQSKFNGLQAKMDNFLERKGLKGYNYDSNLWKVPEGGPPDAPGEAAIVFRSREGIELEALSVVDNAPPRPQEVATQQAKALMNEMGMSEEAWLRNRVQRNRALMNNAARSRGPQVAVSPNGRAVTTDTENVLWVPRGNVVRPNEIRTYDTVESVKRGLDSGTPIEPTRAYEGVTAPAGKFDDTRDPRFLEEFPEEAAKTPEQLQAEEPWRLYIEDGAHRLAAFNEAGEEFIPVKFANKADLEEYVRRAATRSDRPAPVRAQVSGGRPGPEWRRLNNENRILERALQDIVVRKNDGTYQPPAMRFEDAVAAAESVRSNVAGRTPPKMFAFYAENAEQARVEVARGVYQASKETPNNGLEIRALEDALDAFPMERYDDLNALVTEEIAKVQGRRSAKLGERKPAFEDDPDADDFLQSLSDKDPEIRAAKRAALQKFADDNGLPLLSEAAYDRFRTLLQGHIQRGARARAIADEVRGMPGDFTENFLAARLAKTDEDAVQTIRQMLLRHPGMKVEEALRQYELSYIQDGILRKPRKTISLTDVHILEKYFEAKTGAKVDNQQSVIDALGSHGTKPDFKSRSMFRDEAVRKGEWSPRKAEDIDVERPTWSLDEEREFFMNRYGEAPAWTTDSRLQQGGDAFYSREILYQTMVETGNYDETLRIQRALGEADYGNYNDLAFGKKGPDGEWIIRPAKDIERERLWMVQRYGDRVGQVNDDGTVTLTAAPWLMNREEIRQFMRTVPETKTGLLGDLIRNQDELDEVYAAIDRITEKHAKAWVRATGYTDGAQMVIPSAVIHRMAFDIVREVSVTTPWRRFWTKFRNRNLVDAWGWFWRAIVVSNPAFIISNIIDTPTKAIYFSLSNRFAGKTAQFAIDDIPDVHALGIENTAYFNDAGGRSVIERLRPGTSYGNLDRATAIADLFTTSMAKNILQPVERASKTRLARQVYTGLWEELGPRLLKEHGGDREIVKELLLLETRREILRMFPTLDTAGPAERLLNKLMPFISYNFKNRVLWMSEVVEHPWMLYVIEEAQGALIDYNTQWWEQNYPGQRKPEYLFHMIRIPGTTQFLDIGMFTDSARGAELLFGSANNAGDILATLIRPLPAQRAFISAAMYDLFKFGGRYRWQRVFDENGFWTGEHEMVQLPPGTPWGEKRLDYIADFVWTAGFIGGIQTALEDGTMTYAEFVRSAGTLIAFGEFAEPSRYFMTVQKYFLLPDQAARDVFLTTEEGAWLKEQWDAQFFEPTDTASSPFAFNYEEGGPTPEAIRKRWLAQQPPDTRERFFDGWNESQQIQEYWDAKIDEAKTPAERERLWAIRRTHLTQFYHDRPFLWQYAGMGMSENEFAAFQGKRLVDDQREVFFNIWGYDKAPEDAKLRVEWEQDREQWILAHPELKASLEEVKDSYDRSIVERNDRWQKLVSLGEANTRIRELAYEIDDEKLVTATEGLRSFISDGFRMEAFGYDKDRQQWRVKADSLTSKLRAAVGDPEATRDALYSQRMEAAWKEAGDDPLKWHNILDRHQDLLADYFDRNPDKQLTWKQDGKYLKFWGRMGRLADKGQWDQYWDSWDSAPEWVRERFRANNRKGYREFVRKARYNHFMGKWIGLFDSHGTKAAMEYFNSLPAWAREQYYANHPGKSFSPNGGRGFEYVSMLNGMFDQIDAGNWDAAERLWNNAPAWMRRRYYANNPDSKLFRGGSGGGGGGISDSQYKVYIQRMKKWVNLLRDGKEKEAVKYFQSMPKWMQDFYIKNNPDKALLKEDLKMQTLLEDFFQADKAHQNAMLKNHPRLAKWLNENDTAGARRRAIEYLYSRLPDDPWLKRVYREKYPEIFSDEAVGKQKRRAVADTLADHPEFRGPWEEWLEDIYATLQEAMKYMQARPKSPEVDHSYIRRSKHYKGRSAAEVSDEVDEYAQREWKVAKRLPKLDG